LRFGLIAVLILSGLCLAWLVVTALLARRDLMALRSEATELGGQLRVADVRGATATAEAMSNHARRAHRLTGGPIWAVAGRIPGIGEPVTTVRGITFAADDLGSHALPALVAAGRQLDGGALRGPDGRVVVERLRGMMPGIAAAAASIDRSARGVEGLPSHTWFHSIDGARARVLTELGQLSGTVRVAEQTGNLLPRMLGADRPRRYFLAFQNDAEARGTGGLPGAFAIVRAEDGRIQFERFLNDGALAGVSAPVNLGRDYEALYGNTASERLYVNSNLSAHFPYAAAIWAAMWQRKTGQTLDGALAVDPVALSYLLEVTGPAAAPDGTQITAANVVEMTQNSSYRRFGRDNDGRKKFLLDVASAVAARITGARGNPGGLVKALVRAADERRLLVWSADPATQIDLERTPVAGAIPRTTDAYAGMWVVNEGGNKLDYYLDRSLTWERSGCGPTRTVTVTLRLQNSVPPEAVSPWIAERSDKHPYPIRPGDNRVSIYYAATNGALLDSVDLDGRPTFAGSAFERGHPLFTVDVELPQRQSRTVVLHLTEPQTPNMPLVLRQPLVRPFSATVRDTPCAVAGAARR